MIRNVITAKDRTGKAHKIVVYWGAGVYTVDVDGFCWSVHNSRENLDLELEYICGVISTGTTDEIRRAKP